MNIRLDLLAPETMKAVYQDLDEATGLEMSQHELGKLYRKMYQVAMAYRANTGEDITDSGSVEVLTDRYWVEATINQ